MKTDRRISLIISALAVTLTFVIAGSAQMVGGYKQIAKTDADAHAAAVFAVGAEGQKDGLSIELMSVQQAERQVVAGTNYRLCLSVTAGSEASMTVRTVVYRDLKGKYKLTSWTEEDCGGSDD
ncbi:MAG: cystatin domain-containing protein [Acidobacteriota bacterium]